MLGDIDGLYSTSVHPVDFIKDISKKMQVPHRISFGPMELERPSSCSTITESDMQVPDRILIAERVDADNAPSSLELSGDFDVGSIHRPPSLHPPPSTLALDEISYPDLDRLLMEREHQSTSSPVPPVPKVISPPDRTKLTRTSSPSNPTEQINNSACAIISAPSEKRLRALEHRVVQLEHAHVRHKQLEHLGFAVIGLVLVYKILRSLF